MPLGLRVTSNYAESHMQILRQRSDRDLHSRSWPDMRVGLADVALPTLAERVLMNLSLASGYRENEVVSTYGGRGLQRRASDQTQIPLEVGATWVGNVVTRYRGSFTDGEGEDPTGATRNPSVSAGRTQPPSLPGRAQPSGPCRVGAWRRTGARTGGWSERREAGRRQRWAMRTPTPAGCSPLPPATRRPSTRSSIAGPRRCCASLSAWCTTARRPRRWSRMPSCVYIGRARATSRGRGDTDRNRTSPRFGAPDSAPLAARSP